MSSKLDDIARIAGELPTEQRYTLASRILAGIEADFDSDATDAWVCEIRERIRRYDLGESKGVPAEEVFASIENRLAK